MSKFVLVHGAWHGAWCWERVAPLLRAAGHSVVAPDLPGHGADATPWWRVTLGGYARRVRDAALASGGRVIAVGHSMGGCVITQAAARWPEPFAGLVYLCAFVPQPGESLLSLARMDRAARIGGAMKRGLTRTTIEPAQSSWQSLCSARIRSAG